LKPQSGGLIVRTVAEGLTKKGLKADIGYLVKLWEDVSKKREGAKSPTMLYNELDLVLKTARDLFTDDIESIVIDDKEQYARLVRFVEMLMPARVKDIQLYNGDEPIFDAYGIEDEIARPQPQGAALSSGYRIIWSAKRSPRSTRTPAAVGGQSQSEETALKTNLKRSEMPTSSAWNIGGLGSSISSTWTIAEIQCGALSGSSRRTRRRPSIASASSSRDDAQAAARNPDTSARDAFCATAPGRCSRRRPSCTRSSGRSGASATTSRVIRCS
jgi:hypothetical protein